MKAKRNNKMRLRAFTLTELMIVMVLASIVISLGWYIYRNFNQMALNQTNNARRVQEWAAFDQYMIHDFNRARNARLDGKILTLLSAEKDSIRWNLSSDSVTRIAGGQQQQFAVQIRNVTLDTMAWPMHFTLVLGDSAHELSFSHLLPMTAQARE